MGVEPGDILRDRFRIDAPIGRGGMGQVFAATDLEAHAEVAVKVVSRATLDDVLMLRLHREAEAAARIRSDFVPRVIEVSDTEEGETFLVMERLVGEPLSQRIRDNGALPWSEVRRIGEDILRALIDAHTAGIVHRDLKPSNVFLAQKAGGIRAMVLDFGVCKIDEAGAERLTGTGESIGTVAYMAPEQIRGAAKVDERADLYAFGALVFEMLSGRLPHEGASQMAILASKLEAAPSPLRDCARVAIPDGADAIVMRALDRDPERRFANAQELLRAWRALAKVERASQTVITGPLRSLAPDDDLTSSGPPTEIARTSSVPADVPTVRDPAPFDAGASNGSQRTASSLEPSLTQTSLTTHDGAGQRGGGVRVAVLLAAVALVAGLVVVFASVVLKARRGNARPVAAASLASPPVPEPPTAAVEIAPAAVVEADTFELPDEPAPSAAPSATIRKKPRGAPAGSSSAPRITTQPRY